MLLTRLLIALIAGVVLGPTVAVAQGPPSVYDRVVADLNQQAYLEAEELLHEALREHPQDVRALGLMGVTLDAEKRFDEAEVFYIRALKLSPSSSFLNTNLGNHYLLQGKSESARTAYLRAIASDPADPNANAQLAQICITQKKGDEALHYLGRLPQEEQHTAVFQLLRARALRLSGHSSEAEALLLDILKRFCTDPRAAYSVGMVFAEWKRYEQAEEAFSAAQDSAPRDFDVLSNLGLAALGAHHLDRAAQAFKEALSQHPDDVDCLTGMARVKDAQHREDEAAAFLFRAARLAPERPDLFKFQGYVLDRLGLYGNAAAAFNDCLKIRPEDDEARRERGYALARAGTASEGFRDLDWYVEKHPRDPMGLFELAVAESLEKKGAALAHFNKVLALDPKMLPAHLARAVLLRQEGKPSQAVDDLEFVLAKQPDNYQAYDELGEDYLAEIRVPEALEAFRKGASLAPDNPEILWHYARALMRAGEKASAETVMAKLKSLGSSNVAVAPAPSSSMLGSVTPSGQGSASLDVLQKLAAADPGDWQLKFRLAKALLSEEKVPEALQAFQEVKNLTSDGHVLGECGRALLDADQYKAAQDFLSEAVATNASDAQMRLDLVLAIFHDTGPGVALTELEKTSLDQRKGDYYLLRAQLLDALEKPQDAAEALNLAIHSSPTRTDLYIQCALFLVRHNKVQEMVDFLEKADRISPDNPQLLITRAIGFALLHQNTQAQALLEHMESRWPEWFFPYLLHGIVLAYRQQSAEAVPLLETAISLGADQEMAYYHLAWVIITANPESVAKAQAAIDKALALNPKDPYSQSLAGRIAYLNKDYSAAIQHLQTALAIWPDMVEAHARLGAAYRAMGDMDKSREEMATVERIKQENGHSEQVPPFPVDDLLFTVDEPSSPRH